LLTAARALDGKRARLLPALAAVPDPRARRGVRHRLAVISGLALWAVVAGAPLTLRSGPPATASAGPTADNTNQRSASSRGNSFFGSAVTYLERGPFPAA
jgi:hypothetical protein